MQFLVFVIRVFLGGVLLFAGLAKLRHPFDFLSTVYSYDLLGPTAGLLVAAALPWLEAVVGCCLIGGIMPRGALMSAAILLGAFSYATASAWHRGLSISCGCFGESADTISRLTVLRSTAVFIVSLLGLALA